MNEPTEFVFNGVPYIRFNFRVWTLAGHQITDTALMTKLEKAFSDQQRAAAKGRRSSIADLDNRYRAPTLRAPPATSTR